MSITLERITVKFPYGHKTHIGTIGWSETFCGLMLPGEAEKYAAPGDVTCQKCRPYPYKYAARVNSERQVLASGVSKKDHDAAIIFWWCLVAGLAFIFGTVLLGGAS